MSSQTRSERRRSDHANKAVDAQMRGGIDGMIRWTLYGATACVVAHFTWPFFRRQTLALKGFIVSSATVFGLVIGADTHLLNYEDNLRRAEHDLRRRARIGLTREGKMPTEAEILKWREQHGEGTGRDQTRA